MRLFGWGRGRVCVVVDGGGIGGGLGRDCWFGFVRGRDNGDV